MSTLNEACASRACPSFFRRRCRDARCGGRSSYADAGYALAGAVAGLLIQDYEESELSSSLEELGSALRPASPDGLIRPPDDARVLAWFDRHLPACMTLVPRRGRRTFLAGVYQLALDEDVDITRD